MIVKRGDRFPAKWRVNTDLTTASVRLLAARAGCAPVVLAAEVTDAAEGEVTHTFDGTLAPGTYRIVVEVIDGESEVTYPNEGYLELKVEPDIA